MGAERLKYFPGHPQVLTPLEAAATNPAMLDAVRWAVGIRAGLTYAATITSRRVMDDTRGHYIIAAPLPQQALRAHVKPYRFG